MADETLASDDAASGNLRATFGPSHVDLARPVGPDPDLEIPADEVRALIARFRSARNARRGDLIADVRDLPDDPVRVATALSIAAAEAPPDEGRLLNEDFVDLQAFVPDPPRIPGTLPDPGAPPGSPSAISAGYQVLDRIRWRQAAAIAAVRGNSQFLGEHNAIRTQWTRIGDARSALDLAADYRERQAGGFAALSAWVVALPIGAVLSIVAGVARPSVLGVAGLVGCWFLAPVAGAALGWFTLRVERALSGHTRLAAAIAMTAMIAVLAVVPFLLGAGVMILATTLDHA